MENPVAEPQILSCFYMYPSIRRARWEKHLNEPALVQTANKESFNFSRSRGVDLPVTSPGVRRKSRLHCHLLGARATVTWKDNVGNEALLSAWLAGKLRKSATIRRIIWYASFQRYEN